MSCAYSVFLLYIGLMFAAAASLVVRLVRSDGEERQQIKWFIFAAAFVPVWFVLNTPVEQASPVLFSVLDALVVSGVPVAAGIAILRHRLYDIDRIINRTIVYAPLTAALLALYLRGDRRLTAGARPSYRPAIHAGGGRLYPRDRRAFQPPETPHPVVRGPALLQEKGRREKFARVLLHDAPRRD